MPDYGDHEATDDPLQILRHSTAHLLAAAVTELYPDAKYAIGPAIKEPPGFYYDFDFGKHISEADLPAIESRMRRIAQEGRSFEHEILPRDKAIEEFRQRGQDYKLELINDKVSGDGVSVYRTGDFLDLCLGPHVKSTRDLKAFKLQRVSGAYWRGDEKRPQLTRIYGTAWQSQKELDDYLKFLEEAEKRDHKKLGKDLKLFAVDDRVGPGLPLWLPDGATIRRELERFIVDEELSRGYLHVRTPDVARLELFRQSGHAQLYREYMFPPTAGQLPAPHRRLPDGAAQLSRAAAAHRGDRQQLALRALRDPRWDEPCACIRAERRAHLLHAGAADGRGPRRDRHRAVFLEGARHRRVLLPGVDPRRGQGEVAGRRGAVAGGAGRPDGGARIDGADLPGRRGRGRVLRTEDRLPGLRRPPA